MNSGIAIDKISSCAEVGTTHFLCPRCCFQASRKTPCKVKKQLPTTLNQQKDRQNSKKKFLLSRARLELAALGFLLFE
jgi:hypothetical protein